MNDLVSVIMPSYGSEKFISKSIDSVLLQTYDNWELIIIDDCSPDESNKIIKEYLSKYSRIKFVKLEKNSGAAVARNKGIEIAKGRFIAFLDSDDLWLPEKLEKQISFMKDNDLAFTYSSYMLVDEMDKNIGKFIIKPKISYSSMLKTCSVGCLTAIYDSDKLEKVYMPLILKRQDYGTWLKILKNIKTAKGILEPLAIYRIRSNSLSSNKLKASVYQWKIYREVEKLDVFRSLYYFINYAINGFLKYR